MGIWDLNVSAGSLPRLLREIERCQSYFSFFSVQAAFQSVIASPGAHVATEWFEETGEALDEETANANVSARLLYRAAEPVRRGTHLDRLIVVVDSTIADTTREPAWRNLFAANEKRIALVSTFDLDLFAAEAQRPFEVAVFGVALSILLSSMVPKVDYNRGAATGSIFDFCEHRSDIVKSLRAPNIDARNRAAIPRRMLQAADAMLKAMVEYEGEIGSPMGTPRVTRKAHPRLKSAPKTQLHNASGDESSESFTALLRRLQDLINPVDTGLKSDPRSKGTQLKATQSKTRWHRKRKE